MSDAASGQGTPATAPGALISVVYYGYGMQAQSVKGGARAHGCLLSQDHQFFLEPTRR